MNSWDLGPTQLNESEVHEGCLSLQQQHNHVHPEVLPSTVVMLLLMAVKGRRDDDGNALRVLSKEPPPQNSRNAPSFFLVIIANVVRLD